MEHKFKNKEQVICIEGVEERDAAKDMAVKISAAFANAGLGELENAEIEIKLSSEEAGTEGLEDGEEAASENPFAKDDAPEGSDAPDDLNGSDDEEKDAE